MPTVYALFPDIKPAWLDSSADPLSGGKLFIYTAGSSTKATTYTTSAGDVANTNPIVLDSRGEVPHGVYTATGTYKAVLAPSTDTDPPASAIWTRDNLTAPNDIAAATQSEWVTGPTPTFVDGTSFTLVGDQTTAFHVGRRLQLVDSGGTSYARITASSYSDPNTTVTVVNDVSAIDSGLSAVSYALLSYNNRSVPGPNSEWEWLETQDLTNGDLDDVSFVDFASDFADGYVYLVRFFQLSGDASFNPEVKLYNAAGSSIKSGATDYYSSNMIDSVLGSVSTAGDSMPLVGYTGYTSMGASDQLHGEFYIFGAMDTSQRTIIAGWSVWSGSTIGSRGSYSCSMEDVEGNLNVRIGVDGAVKMDRGTAHLYRQKVA